MTERKDASGQQWVKNSPNFVAALPALDFPFDRLPELFAPERTVLSLGDGFRGHTYLWCYLTRESVHAGTSFDRSSLSATRVAAMPAALDRLSKWCRHDNCRPASVHQRIRNLSYFLSWVDGKENQRLYEAVLTDREIAQKALRAYHSFLRSQLMSHQLASGTASDRDRDAVACLSTVHDCDFEDHLEPLASRRRQRRGTIVPKDSEVQLFVSRAQAVFDSAAELALSKIAATPSGARRLRLSAVDDADTVALPDGYTDTRLMELACVAFAALALADSGTNLGVLRGYEEPEDLQDQLARPEKVNLRHRAIKFRAGGKIVPVHLTALTTTRLPVYMRVRQAFVESLGDVDIRPFFVQGAYTAVAFAGSVPTALQPLSASLLQHLRNKFSSIGAELPPVTLRQLRSYKQQHLVRHQPLPVAATIMGHSVETAVRVYSQAQEGLREAEMGQFLGSLEKTVLAASSGLPGSSLTKSLPAGACADYGKPVPSQAMPLVQPDCAKVEGCFFCDKYRLHADEKDLRKLMSCREALKRITPSQPDSARAERVFFAIIDRVDALLGEIQRRMPEVYQDVRTDVEERGNLTTYWAMKLQQLHLLGMLPAQNKEVAIERARA
jgi:hypothetical protein